LEHLRVDGMIILESILDKWEGELWTKFIWLKKGNTGGQHSNELPGSIKIRTFLTS
jgi:hypothetical protein